MSKAIQKQLEKHDYEIMFNDSPEYFAVKNAKFFQEQAFVRFVCFDGDNYAEDVWFPISKIHRIKRYK